MFHFSTPGAVPKGKHLEKFNPPAAGSKTPASSNINLVFVEAGFVEIVECSLYEFYVSTRSQQHFYLLKLYW
jgi:hypothetical protein